MSTLKSSVDQCAENFWDDDPIWHSDLAGQKGNAPLVAAGEALDLR